ncbi:hypothetical protein PENSPDRAFT_745220 [Peniophora sp. CONT]|nr:hypothetical protein PENSPDRAFT_745220 [Peniophora sp. CONT]
MEAKSLQAILAAGAVLIQSDKNTQPNATDLKSLLLSRLALYNAKLGLPEAHEPEITLEGAQMLTAEAALSVIERVQQVLDEEERAAAAATPSSSTGKVRDDGPGVAPSIGTRDTTQLRTLISIVFKWGTEPLLASLSAAWPSKASASSSKLVDISDAVEHYTALKSMSKRLYSLLFPVGVQGNVPQTIITTALLTRHPTSLLRPALALGWIPKPLSASYPAVDEIRPLVMRMLSMQVAFARSLPPSQTIASLGGVLSGSPIPAPHVQKACKTMMSRQLLRPDGVRGLCAVVFGEDDVAGENTSLEKLEHFARVINASPAAMTDDEYFRTIIPRLLALMGGEALPAHRRAAAFALSRMLTSGGVAASIVVPLLHAPFLRNTMLDDGTPELHTSPTTALSLLQTLLANTDPSPTLISVLLSPIVPALYAILGALEKLKASDPAQKEGARGLLLTWGRVVGQDEAVALLWSCVEDRGGYWEADVAGNIKRSGKPTATSAQQALFTPEDLQRAEESGEFDVDANFLGLRPDPAHFVRFLKLLERTDVASELFVRLLEAYRESKADGDSDPTRTLLFLQLVVQMQTQMSDGPATTNILNKPEHILTFVKHVLDSVITSSTPHAQPPEAKTTKVGIGLDDLRIVEEEEDDLPGVEDEGDSDDEDEDPEAKPKLPPDDEMTSTALNLLLSILEANPGLDVQTTPILSDILTEVEQLVKHDLDAIRALAREGRMVLTARLASSSAASSSSAKAAAGAATRETYQKALKLLQDPILPVRAHGLLLLRELVTKREETAELTPLVPAILDIFMQSIQDADSYIFLNAVQGLSALVDGFGKDVLKTLVRAYSIGAESVLTQQELDTRLKVGEALGQVIRRCGDALPDYADILVPPLFAVVRNQHLTTALRASALSLLGNCADTSELALLPYAADLADAVVHLLQLESVRETQRVGKSAQPQDEDKSDETMESAPTAANAKFPPFRRAALHFLALLVRAYTRRAYDGDGIAGSVFPNARVKTVLGYLAVTDADDVVRVMAREVGEAVDDLERAQLGV